VSAACCAAMSGGTNGVDTGELSANVEVRSPTVFRRQAVMFGAFTPKRVSRKRSRDRESVRAQGDESNGNRTDSGE
jgi:hypothetical protein